MKKYLFILGMIFSLLMIVLAGYVFFNIYFVFTNINGQLYDGFGTSYNNGSPSSPYTILGIILLFGGISLFRYCFNKLKNSNKDNKEGYK